MRGIWRKFFLSACTLLSVVMVLPIFSIADISGSKVKGCYDLERSAACFLVYNNSKDEDAIFEVDLQFPNEWTVECGYLATTDSCGTTCGFYCNQVPPDQNIHLGV